jgi:hypothetical protein
LKSLTSNFALTASTNSQGYGYLEHITAYHCFEWLTPFFLISILVNKAIGRKSTGVVDEGFGNFFRETLGGSFGDKLDTRLVTGVEKEGGQRMTKLRCSTRV